MAILLTLAMLLTSISGMVAATPTVAEESDRDVAGHQRIDYREQTVRVLNQPNGESRVSIEVGAAEFSVRWGANSSTGAVELLTVQRRYLGVADIYDANDRFEGRIGIPVEKVFWTDFAGIIEYADNDTDGMFDVDSAGRAGTLHEIMTDATMTHEPVYKYVDLRSAAWSLRDWNNSSDTDSRNRSISFTLVAENITYEGVRANSMRDNTSKLDAVEITFRGTTRDEVVDIESVPHYRVRVDRDSDDRITVRESHKIASSDVTGHVLNTTWDYDVRIRGWDGVHINDTLNGNDSRLFAVTEVATANRMDDRVGDWMRTQFDELAEPKAVVGHARRNVGDDAVGATRDSSARLNVCEEGKVTEIDQYGDRVELTPIAYEARESEHKEEMKPEDQRDAEEEEANRSDSDTSSTDSSDSSGSSSTDTEARGATDETEHDKANMSRRERLNDTAAHVFDRVTGDCADHGELRSDAVRRATAIRGGGLHFEDGAAELGRLRWVNNVTVREDGEEMEFEVVYQVHGRRNVSAADLPATDTANYRGVRLIGGFNYPVAEDVVHDPEFGTDMVTIDESDPVFNGTTEDDQAAEDDSDAGSSGGTGGGSDETMTQSRRGMPGFTGLVATTALFGAALFGRRRMEDE